MDKVSIIGLDISKRSFQVHGATAAGAPVLRRKLTRAKVLEFLASQPRCLVVMETCGGAHHWGREIQQIGHEVRLIAPIYVKAFAKRQKSDARDAAAIVEAAQRPTMRFVAVKTKEAQARSKELRRLTTIPGVGEVTALAVHAFAPSMDSFARGRDAGRLGPKTPRHSCSRAARLIERSANPFSENAAPPQVFSQLSDLDPFGGASPEP